MGSLNAGAFAVDLRKLEQLHLVAVAGDKVVGYAHALPHATAKSPSEHETRSVQLVTLAVAPGYRRLGIATMLYRQVEDWARKGKADRVILKVHPDHTDALAFYARLGIAPMSVLCRKMLRA